MIEFNKNASEQSLEEMIFSLGMMCYNLYVDGRILCEEMIPLCTSIKEVSRRLPDKLNTQSSEFISSYLPSQDPTPGDGDVYAKPRYDSKAGYAVLDYEQVEQNDIAEQNDIEESIDEDVIGESVNDAPAIEDTKISVAESVDELVDLSDSGNKINADNCRQVQDNNNDDDDTVILKKEFVVTGTDNSKSQNDEIGVCVCGHQNPGFARFCAKCGAKL